MLRFWLSRWFVLAKIVLRLPQADVSASSKSSFIIIFFTLHTVKNETRPGKSSPMNANDQLFGCVSPVASKVQNSRRVDWPFFYLHTYNIIHTYVCAYAYCLQFLGTLERQRFHVTLLTHFQSLSLSTTTTVTGLILIILILDLPLWIKHAVDFYYYCVFIVVYLMWILYSYVCNSFRWISPRVWRMWTFSHV